MGSRGPIPKPDDQRVNRRRRPDLRVVPNTKSKQPPLDPDQDWPQRTRDWWRMWGESPLTADFTAGEWSELGDTALLHALVWTPGKQGTSAWFKAMSQLRSRTAAFGATPSDRARLRIQFAFADEAERKAERAPTAQSASPTGARARRGPLLQG